MEDTVSRSEPNGITVSPITGEENSPSALPTQRPSQPNPGYLGPSSHVAIFNQIDAGALRSVDDTAIASPPTPVLSQVTPTSRVNEAADLLLQIQEQFDLISTIPLVTYWLAKGVNLALAESFVVVCRDVVEQLRPALQTIETGSSLKLITYLLRNSGQPFDVNAESDFSAYVSQLGDRNPRLECLGIYLTAVARATIDVPFYPPLYTTETERLKLRTLIQSLNDVILGLCLSLEYLNDLQLVLQYENWILHSYMDGDQSESNL